MSTELPQDSRTKWPPHRQEAILMDLVPELHGRVVCTSPGLAQFAVAAAESLKVASVVCIYLDKFKKALSCQYWDQLPAKLQIVCMANIEHHDVDFVVLPLSANGEAELARDMMQAGHEALRIGGKLLASTENANDKWIGDQLQKMFRKVKSRQSPDGKIYIATKTEPLRKKKKFSCEFAFRDRDRLIRIVSRPGVFSHRHLDPGARHLINAMELMPNSRVLDIGCGAETVALAAACRSQTIEVLAIDSCVRAVQCTQLGVRLNGLTNVTAELNADGNITKTGSFDCALANPPYYTNHRIARHFLETARRALCKGGKLWIVTKDGAWYHEHMPDYFTRIIGRECKGYFVYEGVSPGIEGLTQVIGRVCQ